MKRTLYIYLLIGLTTLSSCVDLNESSKSNITTNDFYKSESEAVSAVNAIYSCMFTPESDMLASGVLFNRQLMMFEMATDDYVAGPRTRKADIVDMSNLNFTANNLAIEYSWEYTYQAINLANIAIDRITKMTSGEISSDMQSRLIYEAKFFRAWNYFNLVRWFGDVPLVLHETTTLDDKSIHPSQSSEEEVYAQIISDFTDAENLPNSYSGADIGRPTSGAAKTFLIKVYITRQEWLKAIALSEELITSSRYALFDNYSDVFNPAKKNQVEDIFSEQFDGTNGYTLHRLAQTTAPNEAPFNGDYVDAPNQKSDLLNCFDKNDTRENVTFVKELANPNTGSMVTLSEVHFHKYWDATVPFDQAKSSVNVPIIRYADVLLMYAEALNEVNRQDDAYTYINKIRSRAKISPLTEGLSTGQFRDSLFQERRKEFVLEYQRWFDLSRRGSAEYIKALKAAGKNNVAAHHIHFPIPQRELDLNPNLHQRDDWK